MGRLVKAGTLRVGLKDREMQLLSGGGEAKLEMWHDLPPPGTESISLPGGAARRLRLGDGGSEQGGASS